jgi:predicted amidohydrolase
MVRVAVSQIEPIIGDMKHNLSLLTSILKQASEANAEVVVLPELANSGYVFQSKKEARSLSEPVPEGPFSKRIMEWTSEGGVVVAGICERADDVLYNSAAVFSDGKHLGTYRKLHLFDKEKEWFLAGEAEPPVFEHNGTRYGLMVCFDWAFPEVARIIALKKAHMILHPANLVLPYCQDAMITRSIENRLFTATANRIGNERGVAFSGMSQITGPTGEVLLRMQGAETGLRFADINPKESENKMITENNDILADRRPKVYWRLTEDS